MKAMEANEERNRKKEKITKESMKKSKETRIRVRKLLLNH